MKKFIALLLCFIMTFSLISCSTINDKTNIPSDDTPNEEKYKPVLDIYKDIIINLDKHMNSKDSRYSEGTKEYEWESAITVALTTLRLSTNVPGYAFCDLNENGSDEILLLLDDYTVLAIFSFANDQPILLDKYWNRKKCAINGDGSMLVRGSGGSDSSSYSIYEISKDDKELVLLSEYGTDGHDPDTLNTYYYKISNGTKTSITVLEYDAALSQDIFSLEKKPAEHTRENANFEFIPLELDYKIVFEKILNYEMKITSENKYLWEYYFPFGNGPIASLNSVEICYLDMDGDETVELILRSDIHDHLILRYHNGAVYLYEYSYKEMARIYEDGSYSWSSPTYLEDYSHQYGISKLSFDEDNAKGTSLYTVFEGENESYFTINRKLASKNELDALIESRKNIKEVTWTTYTLDPDKIPAKG